MAHEHIHNLGGFAHPKKGGEPARAGKGSKAKPAMVDKGKATGTGVKTARPTAPIKGNGPPKMPAPVAKATKPGAVAAAKSGKTPKMPAAASGRK